MTRCVARDQSWLLGFPWSLSLQVEALHVVRPRSLERAARVGAAGAVARSRCRLRAGCFAASRRRSRAVRVPMRSGGGSVAALGTAVALARRAPILFLLGR